MTLDDIRTLVGLQLGRTEIGPDDGLREDLGAESMDLLNLAVAVEDRFGVFLAEEDLAATRTVRDLFDLARRRLDDPA